MSIDESSDFEISSHPVQFHVRNGRGKGVSVYMKNGYLEKSWCTEESFQIAKVSLPCLDILNVYRSSAASSDQFCGKLAKFLSQTKGTLIFGDFNICGQREKNSRIMKFLSTSKFTQLVDEATHIRGRQIDHVYIRDKVKMDVLDIERHSAYYTDHDALLLTLKF